MSDNYSKKLLEAAESAVGQMPAGGPASTLFKGNRGLSLYTISSKNC